MADTEQAFDETFDATGAVVRSVPRSRDRVLSDADLRVLRQNCRDIMNNATLPIWGRGLARAILGLTAEPGVAQPPVTSRRMLDTDGNDLPVEHLP